MNDVQIPEWVTGGIAKIQQPRTGSPSRYPYTYAYDYLRTHKDIFNVPRGVDSRADVAAWLPKRLVVDDTHPLVETVCKKLADAYLIENNEAL